MTKCDLCKEFFGSFCSDMTGFCPFTSEQLETSLMRRMEKELTKE